MVISIPSIPVESEVGRLGMTHPSRPLFRFQLLRTRVVFAVDFFIPVKLVSPSRTSTYVSSLPQTLARDASEPAPDLAQISQAHELMSPPALTTVL